MSIARALFAAVCFATLAAAPTVFAQDERPKTMKYRADDPIPRGYHVEEKPRVGLIVTGAILTGIGGLFLGAGVGDAAQHGHWTDGGEIAAVVSVLFLAPGLPLLIVGVASQKKVLVRNDLSFAPIVTKDVRGGAFTVSF